MKKNTLFFNIAIIGRHTEYVSHFIDYLLENKDTNDYYFVVRTNFSAEFPIIVNGFTGSTGKQYSNQATTFFLIITKYLKFLYFNFFKQWR